jgi:DNA-binding CsgD family transcriptional regulator
MLIYSPGGERDNYAMQASRRRRVQADHIELDPIEIEIIASLQMGKSNQSICDDLGLGSTELVALIKGILKKFRAHDRDELMAQSRAVISSGAA